jgi:amino acid permease
MIAIGGSIGTGLFLGTGRALATGGPGSLLLNYSLVGAVVFLVMLCLGEMPTAEFPLQDPSPLTLPVLWMNLLSSVSVGTMHSTMQFQQLAILRPRSY